MLGDAAFIADIKFKTLRYLGNQYDVDPKADWHKPGNTPVQKAFQQSKYGFEHLARFAETTARGLTR